METKHWAVLIGLITTIGVETSGLQHGWHDAATPQFVGGLILQIATTLGAVFVSAPTKKSDV